MKKYFALVFLLFLSTSAMAKGEYVFDLKYLVDKAFTEDRCYPLADLKSDFGKHFEKMCVPKGDSVLKCTMPLVETYFAMKYPNKESCDEALVVIKASIMGNDVVFKSPK